MGDIDLTPPAKSKAKKRAVSSKRKADAQGAAGVMLDMVDGLGQSIFGEGVGGFEPTERALIEDPLARLMARADPAKMGQFAELLDPFLIGIGLVMYASRINKAVNPPAKPKKQQPLSQTLRPVPGQETDVPARLYQDLTPIGEV